jgi:hypothetical protein
MQSARWAVRVGVVLLVLLTANVWLTEYLDHGCTVCRALRIASTDHPAAPLLAGPPPLHGGDAPAEYGRGAPAPIASEHPSRAPPA